MVKSYFRPKTIKINFTPQGYSDLLQRQKELIDKRPAAIADIQVARSMGDLSENSHYRSARSALSTIDRELKHLDRIIKSASIIKNIQTGITGFGSSIRVKMNGKIFDYQIVGRYESDPAINKISDVSPIGRAVIGHRAGDTIQIITPSGTKIIEIISVK